MGVLLAARLVAGASGASSVVPEGYEDYSLEGGNADQVQVKSRQVSRGHFTPHEVAGFVTKVCEALQRRRDDGAAGAPVLMLEVGVATTDPDWGSGSRIGELPAGHPLRSAVLARAQREGVPAGVCEETRIVVAPWGEVRAEAARLVIERYGVLPQEAEVVLRALRHEVVSCIDANAQAPAQQRASLDRTSLEGAVAEALGVLNTGRLEEALTAGICEPVDLRSPLPDARFYEGVSTQPGHVAAGLVVSRPGIQEAVVAASEAGSPVLLAGPSGVGKSATLWMSLRDMPGVLWFRVRRLRDDDVPALIRLVRAYGASPEAPVGLAVDSVGVGATAGWDALQRELAAVPGSRLVGSVRTEDLAQLSAIADCVVVEVDLDEPVAERIHEELVSSGLSPRTHWRTAFSQANGLTLEYTHLLTSGRRLDEVINDQVRARRADTSRFLELRLIALVATAHAWGTELELGAVQRHLGAPDSDLARAISRLLDEHLVQQRGSTLSGLHQLRSAALTKAAHAVPPPLLADTIRSVFLLVDDDQLGHVVAGALGDFPELHDQVLSAARDQVARRGTVAAWTSVVHALRVMDFQDVAATWPARYVEAGLPPALWDTAAQFTLAGSVLDTKLIRDDVATCAEMNRADLVGGTGHRDDFVRACDGTLVGEIITSATTTAEACRALAIVDDTTLPVSEWVKTSLDGSSLETVLRESDPSSLGELIETARPLAVDLAEAFVEAAGGDNVVLARLQSVEPGLVLAQIEARDDQLVVVAELVHLGDDREESAEAHLNRVAIDLLRCAPACDVTDVRLIEPGGHPVEFGAGGALMKHLHHGVAPTPTQVSWNRTRINLASLAGGTPDATRRTLDVHAIVGDLADYLAALVRIWLEPRPTKAARESAQERRAPLIQRAEQLRPPIPHGDPRVLSAIEGTPIVSVSDPAYSLVQAVVVNATNRLFDPEPNWATLAAFVGDQLRSSLSEVLSEAWGAAGVSEPPAGAEIASILDDLYPVLAELAAGTLSRRSIAAAAGSGRGQLARAAAVAREERDKAIHDWIHSITERAQTTLGHSVEVLTRQTAGNRVRLPVQLAIGVSVVDVEDWLSVLPSLPELVNGHPAARWHSGATLLVPLVAGRPVRRLASQVIESLFPAPELFDTWATEFEEPWPMPLADAVNSAYEAFTDMSSIAALEARRGQHPSDAARVARNRSQLKSALDQLANVRGPLAEVLETVFQELSRVEALVEAELAVPAPAGTPYVASLHDGLRGDQNPEFENYISVVVGTTEVELASQLATPR